MTNFFNDLFRSLNINIIVTEDQALEAIKSIDANYDGSVSKTELFNAFRIMLNTPPPPPQPVQPNYGGYGQYSPYGAYQGYQQPQYYGGQYPQQGYQNYMGQPNPYMSNSYPQNYSQAPYGGYMNQSTTSYMNQSYQPPQQNNPPYNPYNAYKK